MANEFEIEDLLGGYDAEERVKAFAPQEMILCAACKRTNPPTRLDCFYCARPLMLTEEQKANIHPIIRPADTYENAKNLLIDLSGISEDNLEECARILRIEADEIRNAYHVGIPFPVARTDQLAEIELVAEQIRAVGGVTSLLDDSELAHGIPPKRISSLDFAEGKIVANLFNTSNLTEKVEFQADTDLFIVIGSISARKLESDEKILKNKDAEIVGSVEEAEDEIVIDIFPAGENVGYRISSRKFDFSCLGNRKTLLVNTNIRIFIDEIRVKYPLITIDENYAKLGAVLNSWIPLEKNTSVSISKSPFRSVRKESITTYKNDAQFTDYSRMRNISRKGLKNG